MLTCADLWQTICEGGKRSFLITPEDDYSYADLHEAIRRWLAMFDDTDLREGDRLIIRSKQEFAAVSCWIAAVLDGKVPVKLADDTQASRIEAIAGSVDAKCIVDDSVDAAAAAKGGVHHFSIGAAQARPASLTPRKGWLARFGKKSNKVPSGMPPTAASREPALPADAQGLAYLLFTSGTTSAPTGVQITRGNLFANLATLTRLFDYDRRSRIFNDMILAHADGMIQGPVLALANGGAVIRGGGFSLPRIEQWLELVRAHRATHVITVPTIWAMIDAYAAHDDYFDAPECFSLQSVAAKFPDEMWQRLEARFSCKIANHYGLTETVASALYAGPHAEMGPRGTIGKPVDCEARIEPGSAGEEQGELQLKGANIFPGYWRNEERTGASFTVDGWLKTGDLAMQGPDGSFEILGRLKNIIMSGGFLIRPEEIDEAMLQHPVVIESVSVALDDAVFGEIVGTAVVLDGVADIDALVAHAKQSLEAQKVPRRIVILPSIPRGISGKPQLLEVKQLLSMTDGGQAKENDANLAVEEGVIALAAEIFHVSSKELTMDSSPDGIAGWDSFSHLNLVLEAERRFGIRIPASRIAGITTLRDLHTAIKGLI